MTFGHATKVLWQYDGETPSGSMTTDAASPRRRSSAFSGCRPSSRASTTGPPRPSGGNIDCKELVAGTTLYLPIPVDGALFSAGDGHGAQGDGEASGTAIECPLERAQLTLDLAELELRSPIARAGEPGSRSASTRISTWLPSRRWRRCST